MSAFSNSHLFFRITDSKKYRKKDEAQKHISFYVPTPALKEYQDMHFKKHQNNLRICHQYDLGKKCKTEGNETQTMSETKWEKNVCMYMNAKQKYVINNKAINPNFQFLKLSRINKIRKQKMMDSLPIQSNQIKEQELQNQNQNQNVNYKSNIKEYLSKRKEMGRIGSDRLKHKFIKADTLTKSNTKTTNQSKQQHSKRQDKILNNFISNYFKSKFRFSFGQTQYYKSRILRTRMKTTLQRQNNPMIF